MPPLQTQTRPLICYRGTAAWRRSGICTIRRPCGRYISPHYSRWAVTAGLADDLS